MANCHESPSRWNRHHPQRFLQILQIALCVQAIALADHCYAQNADQNPLDVDTNLPRTIVLQHRSSHLLGNTVDVYADDSKPSNIRYYTLFYVYPNWSKATKAWNDECASSDASKTVKIAVDVEVASNRLKQEIIDDEKPPQGSPAFPAFSQSNILIYPYNWLEIYVGVNTFGKPRFVYQWPNPTSASLQTRVSVEPPQIRIPVNGTCSEVKNILDFYDISGKLVTATREFRVQSISAEMKGFTKSQEFEDMFSDATQSGAVTVSTSNHSGSAGLNLGGIFGGGTSSSGGSVQTADTRVRAVTANIVSSAVTNFVSRINTTAYCEYDACSQDQISTLVDLILGKANSITATATERDDGAFDLAATGFKSSLGKEDVQLLMKTSDDPRLKFGEKASATVYSVQGSNEKNFEVGDTRGIEGSKNSKNEWVPTTVKLYLIRSSEIDQDISIHQLAIIAGPAQSGRPVPLATIAPPNDNDSAFDDAVAEKEQQDENDFKYLLYGPPRDSVPLALIKQPGGISENTQYCWSWVQDTDGDYAKLKNSGIRPAAELLRLSMVSNYPAEADSQGHCKTPLIETRGICFVSKQWMIWFKLTRAASHSLDSLLFDICLEQAAPIPGPIIALLPQPASPPKLLPPPTAHEYVKFMESLKPQ